MNLNELIGPAVVAATVSGFVTILGNVFSNRSSRSINSEKIVSEKELAERKFGLRSPLMIEVRAEPDPQTYAPPSNPPAPATAPPADAAPPPPAPPAEPEPLDPTGPIVAYRDPNTFFLEAP